MVQNPLQNKTRKRLMMLLKKDVVGGKKVKNREQMSQIKKKIKIQF